MFILDKESVETTVGLGYKDKEFAKKLPHNAQTRESDLHLEKSLISLAHNKMQSILYKLS